MLSYRDARLQFVFKICFGLRCTDLTTLLIFWWLLNNKSVSHMWSWNVCVCVSDLLSEFIRCNFL